MVLLPIRDPRELIVENVILTRQFERGLALRLERVLERKMGEIQSLLLTRYGDLTQFKKKRMLAFLNRAERMLGQGYSEMNKMSRYELRQFARLQGIQTEGVLRSTVGLAGVEINTTRLTVNQLRAIMNTPVEGLPMGEWWQSQGQGVVRKVRREVQRGLMAGESTPNIARRLVAPSGSPSVLRAARVQARALTRTVVTAIQSEASYQTLKSQGDEITDSYQYVATFDDKTTVICASLDTNIYRYNDSSAPRPPQHINCRSMIVAVVNWQALGVKPPAGLKNIQRASMGGPVKFQSYQTWLRKQPITVQNRVLGTAKGRLFRQRRVSLKQLIRQDGTAISLKELSRKLGEPLAA